MASASGRRAVVRPYNPSTDFEDVVKICEVTAHPSLQSIVDIIPYIYAIPYVKLESETAFVLDAGSSQDGGDKTTQNVNVVGYIIGTPNTQSFVDRYRAEYLASTELPASSSESELRETFVNIFNSPEGMLHGSHPLFLASFPAHLHIDILPSHQKQGYGSILMSQFLSCLENRGVKGVHLGMGADNTPAGRFYERHGFVESADIKMDGTTWMVKGLE